MDRIRTFPVITLLAALSLLAAHTRAEEPDPPEVAIGERLFRETRFAQFFAAQPAGGDPVMEQTETVGAPLPGPFAGAAMNCAACHLVDQHLGSPGGGMRTYNDFARRSPIPAREDGQTPAARNSPPLVNAALARDGGLLLHFDGEFASLEDLVSGTLTGRNYGWLPRERAQAIAHIAEVIRTDDGSGALAGEFGGSYRQVLAGAPEVPEELRLGPEYRIDVERATDRQITAAVAELIGAYVASLVFQQDDAQAFNGSPYDRFLAANGLPPRPEPGETDAAYGARLLRLVTALANPVWVDEGSFAFHDQAFRFGPEELAGLRLFMTPARNGAPGAGAGNCVSCHAPPTFTDFGFHNTGVTQFEYDRLHGAGAFGRLAIPGLLERLVHYDRFMPATQRHPDALEPFRAAAADAPGRTDLGLWNIAFNPEFPTPQRRIQRLLCRAEQARAAAADSQRPAPHDLFSCWPNKLLERSVAAFKTPGLRDPGHSAPYMHNGGLDSLEAVIEQYRGVADLARSGQLRNGDPALQDIVLAAEDVAPVAAFLRALNEDYE
jgi:cytochrome c peroxidase